MITKHKLTCKFVNTADPLKPRDKARTATTMPLSFRNGIVSSNPPGIMCAIIVQSMRMRSKQVNDYAINHQFLTENTERFPS